MRTLCIFFLFFFLWKCAALRICGNYCGPSWCNGQAIPEKECDTSVAPLNDVYKVDDCCRKHDNCCGFGVRQLCNSRLVTCIAASLQSPDKELGDKVNTLVSTETWVAAHFFDEFICGNGTQLIADFFIALEFFDSTLLNRSMCCGTQCE